MFTRPSFDAMRARTQRCLALQEAQVEGRAGIVGFRILSIREMVFTLCLILILDPFFSTNTMPLADFEKLCPKFPFGPPMKF